MAPGKRRSDRIDIGLKIVAFEAVRARHLYMVSAANRGPLRSVNSTAVLVCGSRHSGRTRRENTPIQ